jgi:hypothetical protein
MKRPDSTFHDESNTDPKAPLAEEITVPEFQGETIIPVNR